MARVPTAVLNLIHRFPRLPQAPTRRHRSGGRPPAAPALSLTPGARPRPWVRALGLVAVVLLGAWLGLLVVGNVRVPVGPMNTTMTLRPSFTGGTKINVSPLGAALMGKKKGEVFTFETPNGKQTYTIEKVA